MDISSVRCELMLAHADTSCLHTLVLPPSITRNFVLKHRVFLLRNWEKMREKQELLKREGERERDASSLSMYTRWGGVIRDDGNIKSGECASFKGVKRM